MTGWTDEAREASAEARRGNEQRFHLSYKYMNPEKGWENTGNQVVRHESLEGAAQQIMRERNIPSMTVTTRNYDNPHPVHGLREPINRQFTNSEYKAPPPPAPTRKGRSRRVGAYSR